MRSLSLLLFLAVFLLSSCGGEKPPSQNENQSQSDSGDENNGSENPEPPEISLDDQSADIEIVTQLINGQPVDPNTIVSESFANGKGSLVQASVGEGNLTLGVSAQDPDGLSEVSLFIPSESRNFILCSTDCGTDFQITLTGINPQLLGATPGSIRFELFVSDALDNRVGADALNANWQPIQISALNASRENGQVFVNWAGSSTLERYNLYAATQYDINKENILSFDNGLQQLAIFGTSTQFVDADPSKEYHVLLTGIDSDGESGYSATLTIPRTAGLANHAPIANSDNYQIEEDQPLVANVIENDSDNEGQFFILSAIVVPPVNGNVTLDDANQLIYTPLINFVGQDRFVYQITDSEGASAQATVIVNIGAVNDNPVANNDSYVLNLDKSLTITSAELLSNDVDVDGDSLSVVSELVLTPSFGDVEVNDDGSFSYSATNEFVDQDSFDYQISDGQGGESQARVYLLLNTSDQPPIAQNDDYQTNEDSSLIVNLVADGILANDNDPNDRTFQLVDTLAELPQHGQLNLSVDGTFSYIPESDFFGFDQFQYQIINSAGVTAQTMVTIEVLAQIDTPITVNNSYQVNEDTTLNIIEADGLLNNDLDPDLGALTVNITPTSVPSQGSVTLQADGSFVYTADANFNGVDSFSYQVTNTSGETNTAQVLISVLSVNDLPVATIDSYSVDEDNTLSASSVLSNDSDADGDTLVIDTTPISGVSQGNLTLFSDGTFTYVPKVNSTGSYTFTYGISDGNGGTAQAVVTITVNAINDDPTAVSDNYSLNEDTILNGTTLLANDSDIEGDSLTINSTPTAGVTNGSLTLGSDGSFSYTPNSAYFGNDTFSYELLDGNGGTATTSVNLTITSVNDIPVAEADSYSVDEDTILAGSSVLVNDSDPDDDTLVINTTAESDVSNGNLTLFANGTFSYLADGDFNGVDNFTYSVEDGQGGSETAIVSITVNAINDAPTASSDSYSLSEGDSLNVGAGAANRLLNNDNDIDGDVITLSTSPVVNVSNGNLTLNSDSSFVYTPNANFSGSDSFTYQINDGKGATANASVALSVTNINDAPIATNDSFTVTNGFTLSAASVLTNDSDLDGDSLTINTIPVAPPSSGTLVLSANGTFTYTPITDGIYNFTYQVNDGNGLNDIGVVTVTVNTSNNAPVGINDNFVVVENHVFNGSSVLSNDTDADGNTLLVNTTPTIDTIEGNLTLNADGSFSYIPDADYIGSDTFTYELNDGSGGTSTAQVFLNINPNAVPNAVNDSYQMDEDSVLNATTVLINDVDAEGDTLIINTTAIDDVDNGSLTINADGSFTYTPNANFTGLDSFTYEVDDGNGDTNQAVVSITVDPINDLPVGVTDSYSTNEDTVLNGSTVLVNDSDIDGDTLTINTLAISTTTKGELTLNSDGTFVYSPYTDANGSDSFIYQINDGQGGSDEATVNITINTSNDTPVAVSDSFNMVEDTVLTITAIDAEQLLANDSDADGDSLMINTTPNSNVTDGVLVIGSDGGFTYTPNADFAGVDSFVYQLEDGQGGVTTGSVSITVSNINDIPVTVNDAYSTDEDSVLNGSSVLLNDSDNDGDSLSLITSAVSGSSNGIVVLSSNGTFVYTANTDFFGNDSFVYQTSDGNGGSANGTVNITVNNINDAPVAYVDNYTVNEDSVLTKLVTDGDQLLSNDDDIDGDSLAVNTTPVTPPNSGNLVLNSDGSFTYTPNADFNGIDGFIYQITDGNGENDQAQVNITVDAVNDKPDATDQSFNIDEDKTDGDNVGTVTASDIEGDNLSFAIIGGDASLFNIDSSSGQIKVNGATPLNFENSTQHSLSIEITDDGSPNEASVISVIIDVNDVLEPVVPTELTNFGRPAADFFELTGEKTQAKLTDSHRDGGKIYFVGSQENIDQDIYMVAYNKDGTLDTGFGNNGEQIFDFGHHETVRVIAEKDGKYYLVFESFNGIDTEICFVQVDNNGDLDTDLGVNGVRCTEEQSDLSINDMVVRGDYFFAVGRKRTTNDDLLIIKIKKDLEFIDLTPGDGSSLYIFTDISGAGRDDEGLAIFEPKDKELLITGRVRSVDGDIDIFAWLIEEEDVDDDGIAITTFNGGDPATYDIGGFDDIVQAIGGKKETDFTAYLAGYTILTNGMKEASIIAIDDKGALSSSFPLLLSGSGIATYDVDGGTGNGYAEFTGIVFDSDDLYLSGSLYDGENKQFSTRIIVDEADVLNYGMVDSAYGSDGYRTVAYGSDDSVALSMSLDGDKTTWIPGYRQTGGETKMIITAIDVDGNRLSGDVDGDFVSGQHTISYTSTPSDDSGVQVLKINNGTHAGKFITLSVANDASINNIVLTRFTADGALDTSFDSDGHKQVHIGSDAIAKGLIELSDGKLVLYGNVTELETHGFIAKLDEDANLDSSFAINGIYTTVSITADKILFNQAAVDNNNSIVAVGELKDDGDDSYFILRLNSAGNLDNSFSSNGYHSTSEVSVVYNSLAIDASNNIIIGGYIISSSRKKMQVSKYTNTGSFDSSFSGNGRLNVEVNSSADDFVTRILIDGSANIYLVGNDLATPNKVAVVKMSATGILDTSYSGDGIESFVMAPNGSNAAVNDAILDSDNNIIVIGSGEISGVNTPMIGRIKPDATLDSMFNTSGFFNATSCTNAAQLNSLLLLDDTNIVVAGHCYIDGTFKNNLELTHYQLLEP